MIIPILELLDPEMERMPVILKRYLRTLPPKAVKEIRPTLKRALLIPLSGIKEVYASSSRKEVAWRVPGKKEGYVVARDVSIAGVSGIRIGKRIWSCECGDFLWHSQALGLPCKHIIRVWQLLEKKEKR